VRTEGRQEAGRAIAIASLDAIERADNGNTIKVTIFNLAAGMACRVGIDRPNNAQANGSFGAVSSES
jgi:hypothetical protein